MRAKALRKLLAQAPDNCKNLLITHKPNMIDVLGKDWFDAEEGEASIFKPDEGGKYRFVARVQMEERPKLGVVAKQTSNGSLVSLKASGQYLTRSRAA
jgi:hypothetical protein